MSIRIMTYVWEHSKQRSTNLLMLLAIADMANDDGDCWPGVKRLAKKTRMSDRNVQKICDKLERDGELIVKENSGKKTPNGWTNLYHIPTPERVNASSPVSHSSPQGVNASSPQGVNASSPKSSLETSLETSEREAPPPNIPANYRAMQNGLDPRLSAYLDTWRDAHEGVKPIALRGRERDDALEDVAELIHMECTPDDLTAFIKERQSNGKSTVWKFMIKDIHEYLTRKQNNGTKPAASPAAPPRTYIPDQDITLVWNMAKQTYDHLPGNQTAQNGENT